MAGRMSVDRLVVRAGDRILIPGPNRAGKTTLLSVLAADLAPDRGTVNRHGRVGWLPQELPTVDPRHTLLRAYTHPVPVPDEDHRAALLALGLFRAEDLDTPADGLSVGQQRRLALARLLSTPTDILLLDEPTNHLSPGLVEDLEQALLEYAGALLIVSHDRMLSERFAGDRIEMAAGQIVRTW